MALGTTCFLSFSSFFQSLGLKIIEKYDARQDISQMYFVPFSGNYISAGN